MADGPVTLTKEDKERIEKNRQQALSIRMKKSSKFNKVPIVETIKKNIISINGNQFRDTCGGFLIEETQATPKTTESDDNTFELLDITTHICKECQKEFFESYLYKYFEFNVCDGCRDSDTKYSLITRSDLKKEYLLKDCDIDKREPPLKFISKKNPHNQMWGDMKLYLLPQVIERAIEVWGSLEKLEEEHSGRVHKRVEQKAKKYNKNLKALRMSARSSLYNRTKGPNHEHNFGPETYNEDEDNYSRSCITCSFVDTYEKM
ncbi:DNA repair protein complementing XP-A cells homolog isoform X2 [Cimex lectularius]|uniref:XPA C-terminal domain-containing protein n=1 Tax=Cimex lectularius TaxID=79782 RepID=A0A8I6RS81_CIMLE|nr:DNA repair protein complementing XP-A cells homolog isoform X2 [Cimex lectularius]